MDRGRIVGRSPAFAPLLAKYMHLDGPLFDLIGKLSGKAVWQLIGEPVRALVQPYDSTFYFSDVWFRSQGIRAAVDAVHESKELGFTCFKFKLGRGFKWMDRDAGLKRDIAVTEAVRNAVGPNAIIMGDANNGYAGDLARAWLLLSETRHARLHWIEQIFPASVGDYTWLNAKLAEAQINTLIADGEGWHEAAQFEPYLEPHRLVDVLQMDIRRGGFLGNLAVARIGEAAGAITVPHNWASQIGLFMGLQFAKAVGSAPLAEDDRSTCDVIEADGYRFEKGFYAVPSDPGLGIHVDSKVYDSKYKKYEMVVT
jgi:L-alanine-DL-glutamate epimerase-like enolase superfamily enzyme